MNISKHFRSFLLITALLAANLACNLPTTSTPAASPTDTATAVPVSITSPATLPATLPVETIQPPPSPTIETPPVTAEVTPECETYASNLTLAASQTSPKIGDTLVLTAILSNVGTCGMLGLPQYTLRFSSDAPGPILEPNPPEPVVHSLGIQPGQSDTITYTLQVVGAGVITISISASFEVHLGYPGPAYWSNDNSEPITITVQPPS
jgi:hypothetical protein